MASEVEEWNQMVQRHGGRWIERDDDEQTDASSNRTEGEEDDVGEEEGDNNNPSDGSGLHPTPVLGIDDPGRMQLTPEERVWAMEVKDAIEQSPELDNLSDFMYCQLALIEKGHLEGAVKRAHQLQAFREEYGLLDTKEDGIRFLCGFVGLFPRHFLSFSFSVLDGNYIFIYDMKSLNIKLLNTPDKVTTWICCCYYVNHCLSLDFESIRRGAIVIAECEGYDWTKNIDVSNYRKYMTELGVAYPIRFQKAKYFHSGMFVNLLFSMTKRFLPEGVQSILEVGCQFDGGRLDEVYLTPTVEIANQRLLARFEDSLRRRYQHERTFSLRPSGS